MCATCRICWRDQLPFSDFTDEKLAKVIPEKTTRILIYCNNNFSDNVNPIMLKRIELALNVPTFVNLWGIDTRTFMSWAASPSLLMNGWAGLLV